MTKNITIASCHSRVGGNLDACLRRYDTKFVSLNSIGFTIVTANHLIKKLQNGEYMLCKGKRYLGKNYKGPKVSVAALRNDQGVLVIIATNDNPNIALNIYKKRWEIENLFACLKTRGFNFENTHIIHLDRISKLLGLLAIAFTFAYVVR